MLPRPRRLAPLALAAAVAAGPAAAADPAPPPGFTPLFNGKDLAGWHGWKIHDKGGGPYDADTLLGAAGRFAAWTADARKHWTVENGELVNDGHGAYLVTDRSFGDYELLIEYKTVPRADSGIYLKATPQVQIWDFTDPAKFKLGADKGSGGLWNNDPGAPGKDPLVLADRPFGEWNSFRILQVGERTTIHLNDKLVVDHARLENYYDKAAKRTPPRPLPAKGPVVLQTHGGEIRWRNICVRELAPAEANDVLRAKAGDGYKPVFDGQSLDGWAGAVADYEVRAGAIVCKPGRGGNLFTTETFADFAAQVEFKLPPGGNNGLLVRYPGAGDGAYDGTCEVQVLDDTFPKYAGKIDPRQATGSAYGMVPAAQGYLRPVGEWNLMEVTVRGPKIQVELNGSRVTDGDLSQVTDFLDGRPHPGKGRADGHLGFAGHNDPVQFRNVRVKPLK